MAITVAQLQTDLDAARTALASSDFATALQHARCALAVLAGLPNSSIGESRVDWRDSINQLIAACERGLSQDVGSSDGGGGIQRTKITYTEVTD